MPREIKFRVWDTIQEAFITNAYGELQLKDGSLSFDLPDYWVIQQFTGLTDKNGIGIYEGDIIKSHSNFVVSFESYKDGDEYGHTGFCLRLAKGGNPFGFGNDYEGEISKTFEVIGNIFQNSELLKL